MGRRKALIEKTADLDLAFGDSHQRSSDPEWHGQNWRTPYQKLTRVSLILFFQTGSSLQARPDDYV